MFYTNQTMAPIHSSMTSCENALLKTVSVKMEDCSCICLVQKHASRQVMKLKYNQLEKKAGMKNMVILFKPLPPDSCFTGGSKSK